jgi:NADP-dependent 3-hydroxy acid dehydrogenase YdfG
VRFHGDQARADKVCEDITPLTPDDIADAIVYAATRPLHVDIAEILVMPTAQASATMSYREKR